VTGLDPITVIVEKILPQVRDTPNDFVVFNASQLAGMGNITIDQPIICDLERRVCAIGLTSLWYIQEQEFVLQVHRPKGNDYDD
jgi:hypothetical protein